MVFVHPSDEPSSANVSLKLIVSNHHFWPRSMRQALGGKLKHGFVTETITPISDTFDPLYYAWNRCNILVHSWILNFVPKSIFQSIVFRKNAVDV